LSWSRWKARKEQYTDSSRTDRWTMSSASRRHRSSTVSVQIILS
jgi:hypothetical protein